MTRRRRIRKTITAGLALLFVVVALLVTVAIRWSNHPITQHRILAWINAHTQWEITVDVWQWRLASSTIQIKDLSILHRANNHYAHADSIEFSYSPWTLMRGAIKLTRLAVTNLVVRVHDMPAITAPRKRLTLRNMLVLQNLEIQDGAFDRVTVMLPKQRSITAERVGLFFDPGFFGRTNLAVQIVKPYLFHNQEPLARLASLSLTGSTNVKSWVNMAPFINDVSGSVNAQHLQWRTLVVDDIAATAHLVNSRVTLDALRASVAGHIFQGDGFVDLGNAETAVHLAWKEPMPIPELLHDQSFLTSAGTIQGTIDWTGSSFTPATLTGQLAVDLTHVPAQTTTLPARLRATGSWENGHMTLQQASLLVDKSETQIHGSIDIPKRMIDIDFEGHDIPLLGVMGRFRRREYHPVSGTAHCTGTYRGWKRDFRFDLMADTARGVTYQQIAAEDMRLQMTITEPQLTLHGDILQNGHATGSADLAVRYTPRQADGTRTSNFQLTAKIDDHQLAPSFAAVELTGVGSGTMTLAGGSAQYRGTGQVHLRDGTFAGLPFEEMTSQIAFAPQTITFAPSEMSIPNVPPIALPQALVMQFDGAGFHLRGSPAARTTVDVSYTNGEGAWTIHNIQFSDASVNAPLHITGHGRKGQWDLTLQGTANAQWSEFIPVVFREAEGPLAVRLHLRGTLSAPSLDGTITLQHNRMLLRDMDQEWSELTGVLQFSGSRIHFNTMRGFLGDGPFTLSGWAEHESVFLYPRYDLALKGDALYFTFDDRHLRTEVDSDIRITRSDGINTHITGALSLVEGFYDRDFRLLEQATRRQASIDRERIRLEIAGYDKVHLDLAVQSRGELLIRNNVGEVPLRAKIQITGTFADPKIRGTIESTSGKLHYLGLDFDIVTGVMEFHPPLLEPFIEFRGEETVGTHLVQVILRGPTNKLRVELNSIPGEDRKNILCLIAYGTTCDQLRFAQFGAKIGPGIFIEQLGRVLQRPITKITGLDTVRVESVAGSADLSQLYLGKKISDRLEVSFVTTVGQSAADQSLEAAYQITDFLLLKARQSTRHRTQANVSLRFRER